MARSVETDETSHRKISSAIYWFDSLIVFISISGYLKYTGKDCRDSSPELKIYIYESVIVIFIIVIRI